MAFENFHDDVGMGQVLEFAQIVDFDNVGVADACGQARFASKTLEHGLLRGLAAAEDVYVEDFNGDVAFNFAVECPVDDGKSAGSEFCGDCVTVCDRGSELDVGGCL